MTRNEGVTVEESINYGHMNGVISEENHSRKLRVISEMSKKCKISSSREITETRRYCTERCV